MSLFCTQQILVNPKVCYHLVYCRLNQPLVIKLGSVTKYLQWWLLQSLYIEYFQPSPQQSKSSLQPCNTSNEINASFNLSLFFPILLKGPCASPWSNCHCWAPKTRGHLFSLYELQNLLYLVVELRKLWTSTMWIFQRWIKLLTLWQKFDSFFHQTRSTGSPKYHAYIQCTSSRKVKITNNTDGTTGSECHSKDRKGEFRSSNKNEEDVEGVWEKVSAVGNVNCVIKNWGIISCPLTRMTMIHQLWHKLSKTWQWTTALLPQTLWPSPASYIHQLLMFLIFLPRKWSPIPSWLQSPFPKMLCMVKNMGRNNEYDFKDLMGYIMIQEHEHWEELDGEAWQKRKQNKPKESDNRKR